MKELIIKDLHVSVEGKEILKGVNLSVYPKSDKQFCFRESLLFL